MWILLFKPRGEQCTLVPKSLSVGAWRLTPEPINMTLQSGFCVPKKQADGTYVISLPVSPDLTMAVLDASIDFGLYVQALIEDPRAGSEVLTGSLTSLNQMAAGLSKGMCRRLFPPQCCSSVPAFVAFVG